MKKRRSSSKESQEGDFEQGGTLISHCGSCDSIFSWVGLSLPTMGL